MHGQRFSLSSADEYYTLVGDHTRVPSHELRMHDPHHKGRLPAHCQRLAARAAASAARSRGAPPRGGGIPGAPPAPPPPLSAWTPPTSRPAAASRRRRRRRPRRGASPFGRRRHSTGWVGRASKAVSAAAAAWPSPRARPAATRSADIAFPPRVVAPHCRVVRQPPRRPRRWGVASLQAPCQADARSSPRATVWLPACGVRPRQPRMGGRTRGGRRPGAPPRAEEGVAAAMAATLRENLPLRVRRGVPPPMLAPPPRHRGGGRGGGGGHAAPRRYGAGPRCAAAAGASSAPPFVAPTRFPLAAAPPHPPRGWCGPARPAAADWPATASRRGPRQPVLRVAALLAPRRWWRGSRGSRASAPPQGEDALCARGGLSGRAGGHGCGGRWASSRDDAAAARG